MMEEVMERDYDRSLDDNLCMVWEQDSLDETNAQRRGLNRIQFWI
jgi:hypothetical protein